jgi:plastocyanin
MKNNYLLILLCIVFFNSKSGFCTHHTISATNSQFVFTPSTLNAQVGDTIIFSLGSIHSALEVSQPTWDANGNTPLSGGFSLPSGGGSIVVTEAKTYYYVCGVHYYMGMKGTITVTGTGFENIQKVVATHAVTPNPATSGITISPRLPLDKKNDFRIFDITGKCICQKDNVVASQYIDVSAMAAGAYFVAVRSGAVVYEQKIIIQK